MIPLRQGNTSKKIAQVGNRQPEMLVLQLMLVSGILNESKY
jgi:hypothetical protein